MRSSRSITAATSSSLPLGWSTDSVNFTDLLVRGLGGEPREDALQAYRALGDWKAIASLALPKLKASGIDFDAAALAALLPEVFASAEFRGGLEAFEGSGSAA